MKRIFLLLLCTFIVHPINVHATEDKSEECTIVGAASGVAIGATVAGIVGAAVGGTVGAIIGTDACKEEPTDTSSNRYYLCREGDTQDSPPGCKTNTSTTSPSDIEILKRQHKRDVDDLKQTISQLNPQCSQQVKQEIDCSLSGCSCDCGCPDSCTTQYKILSVYFKKSNEYKLDADAKKELHKLRGVHYWCDHLQIIGYADQLGPESSNEELSAKRANSVADYIYRSHFLGGYKSADGTRVANVTIDKIKGLGEFSQSKDIQAMQEARRVDVKIHCSCQ